jgi:two-component system, chemotaxis family, protein-glutamate methylesterase/glutaminase
MAPPEVAGRTGTGDEARREGARGGSRRDVVVVGASAGGVEALSALVAGLPGDLPAAVCIVLHVANTGTSVLPSILDRAGALPVRAAHDGERLEPGRVYVAPPDFHMLVEDSQLRLSRGPRENGHRPAVDPLFRSAAEALGPRVIGVVLSGALDDGTAGLAVVKQRGGATVAQDPEDAAYPSMPASAIANHTVQHVVAVAAMPALICDLIDQPADPPDDDPTVTDPPLEPGHDVAGPPQTTPTHLTCPECGGALVEREEGTITRYRCHVGHAYSPASLDVDQGEALEATLWAALRALEERAELFRRLARRAKEGSTVASRFEAKAREVEQHAGSLRGIILSSGRAPSPVDVAVEAEAS